MGKDSVVIGALLGAIAGAALGRYVEKLWASEPSEDNFGERLARLEREIEELEALQRRHKESPPTSGGHVPGLASSAAVSGTDGRSRFPAKPNRLRFQPRENGHFGGC